MRAKILRRALLVLGMTLCTGLPVTAQETGLYHEVLRVLEKSGVNFDEARARRAAAAALIKSADPLGDLMTEAQVQQLQERHLGRVYDSGIHLKYTNGVHTVRLMVPGAAAPRAGVNVGDTLLEVNGVKCSSRRFSEAIEMLRSGEEKALTLKLEDLEGATRAIELKLKVGQLESVELIEELSAGIGYIKINGLYRGGAEKLVKQIRNWERQRRFGIILDLRNANGRDLATVKTIAEQFAQPNSPLFTFQNAPLNQVKAFASGEGQPIGLPVMLLVNGRTSGASELLVATLKGSGLGAMVLGEATAGDFALRQFVKLKSGDSMYVATHQVLMRDGTIYDGSRGVQPDVIVEDVDMKVRPVSPELSFNSRESTRDEDRIGEQIKARTIHDAVMQRAFDVLLGLKALNIRAIGRTP